MLLIYLLQLLYKQIIKITYEYASVIPETEYFKLMVITNSSSLWEKIIPVEKTETRIYQNISQDELYIFRTLQSVVYLNRDNLLENIAASFCGIISKECEGY